jgi:hypothetical protein
MKDRRFAFVEGLQQLTFPGKPKGRGAEGEPTELFMKSAELSDVFDCIRQGIQFLRAKNDRVVVVLDSFDFMLAAPVEGRTAAEMYEHIIGIREVGEPHSPTTVALTDGALLCFGFRWPM